MDTMDDNSFHLKIWRVTIHSAPRCSSRHDGNCVALQALEIFLPSNTTPISRKQGAFPSPLKN